MSFVTTVQLIYGFFFVELKAQPLCCAMTLMNSISIFKTRKQIHVHVCFQKMRCSLIGLKKVWVIRCKQKHNTNMIQFLLHVINLIAVLSP